MNAIVTMRRFVNNGRIVIPIVVLAFVAIVWQAARSMQRHPLPEVVSQAYFSDDDGQTWFVDTDKNVPPFDHNGKTAVLAFVYRTADGKQFVHHLEEYPNSVKAQADAAFTSGSDEEARVLLGGSTPLVKKPGDKTWIRQTDPQALSIMSIADLVREKGMVSPVFP